MHYYRTRGTEQVPGACRVCQKPMWVPPYSDRMACSAECRWWLQPNAPRSCLVPDEHQSRSSLVPALHPSRLRTRSTQVWIPTCLVCGALFVARRSTAVTCSNRCRDAHKVELHRAANHRRRAVQLGAYVADVHRLRVHVRDGWRCHICKRKVLRSVAVPHPRAPTLDHLVPLSRGGAHEPANVRTACFLCNSAKGPRGGNEQLLLIG